MSNSLQVVITTSKKVNRTDYYSDLLVKNTIQYIQVLKNIPHSILEIGTGRGYVSIVLAKKFPSIKKIVATDVDSDAIALAKKNVTLNSLTKKIKVIEGSLFLPAANEKFDLVVSVPPQLPLTKKQVQYLLPKVEEYHVKTSSGGKTGRDLLDKIIFQSPKYLKLHGSLVLVHSDIVGFDKTIEKMEKMGFSAQILGTKKKLLSETTLTRLTKSIIEKSGYKFKKDRLGREFVTLGVLAGTL